MSSNIKVIVDRDDLVSLADSIREKSNFTDELSFSEFSPLIDSITTGTSTNIPIHTIPVGGIVQSTSAGRIIYANLVHYILTGDPYISTANDELSYTSPPGVYRANLGEGMLLNTPIIIITSGTPTLMFTGYTSNLITSGDGYYVYTLSLNEEANSGSESSGPTSGDLNYGPQ